MKKSIFILGSFLIAVSLMGVGHINSDQNMNCAKTENIKSLSLFLGSVKADEKESDIAHIFQGFGPRFNPIKRSELITAFSARSFLPKEHLKRISTFNSTTIKLITEDRNYGEGISNFGELMSKEQLTQLNNLPYSSNFVVEINTGRYDPENGLTVGEDQYTPHLTLVPEVQAEYQPGLGALFQFLRLNSQPEIDRLDEDNLGPGRLYITIGKNGKLQGLKLWSSSRNEAFDNRVIELMSSLPGEWKPAEDAEGNTVEQELVLFFGLMGC